MAQFANTMSIDDIAMEKSVKCFCPIGKSWCTYEIDISMEPLSVIPDYLEVEKYLDEQIGGAALTMEDAASNVRDHIAGKYFPKFVRVSLHCSDAKHMPVTVGTEYRNLRFETEGY